jgi:hypothetical protein
VKAVMARLVKKVDLMGFWFRLSIEKLTVMIMKSHRYQVTTECNPS